MLEIRKVVLLLGAYIMPEITYFKTQLRKKGQITMPAQVRKILSAAEGDDLAFYVKDGRVIVEKLQVIHPDQAWFWTERWQKMEQEAQADIDAEKKTLRTIFLQM
jgi:AbrB family looped-hinge helix DNA binding protein